MQTATEVTKPQACAAQMDMQAGLMPHDIFARIGTLTRSLHDMLRELGYDKGVEEAVGALPDACARLDYIATLTGKAAERVLDAAERAKSAQHGIRADSLALYREWNEVLGNGMGAQAMHDLGRRTQKYLAGAQLRHETIDCQLSEIMLAQDFHGLTWQAIQRVARLARSLEQQLVKLLFDASLPAQRQEVLEIALAGPVLSGEGRDEVVTDQGQVEDLLEGMGF
jgi:chemotaxis protein CheZ